MTTVYKILVEYDGSGFAGWQMQDKRTKKPTVAGALQKAIFEFSGEKVQGFSAGRTDAGVHAIEMTAHFSLSRKTSPREIVGALGFYLNKAGAKCSVLKAAKAKPDFHARFSCKGREYLYKILNRPARTTLQDGKVWQVAPKLDVAAMNKAAQFLVGNHDFSSFRAGGCQAKSPIKTLDSITVRKSGGFIIIRVKARSFLYHQVRNMVGTLKLVGEGKLNPEDMKKILKAKSRPAAGPTAPADGLYFVKASY
jgi:tRNA pseudouridine38-40 synthase